MKAKYDYAALETEFVLGNMSIRELARRHDIAEPSSLHIQARKRDAQGRNWYDKQRLRQAESSSRLIEAPKPCVVCGKECGSLRGDVRSWRCAGLLSKQTAAASRLRERYRSEGKEVSRRAVVRYIEESVPNSGRVLDLWGGGLSARAIVTARPDLEVHSCEADRTLWAAMERDAAEYGYVAHKSDFRRARGLFDFIWLDLCSPLAMVSLEAIRDARVKLRPGAGFAVTLMPERENDEFLVRTRPISIPALVVRESGRAPDLVLRYDRGNGHEMWLMILSGRPSRYDPIAVANAIEAEGEWGAGPYLSRLLS